MLRDAKQWNRGILREEKSEGKWVDFSMHIISLCRTIQKTHVEDILKVTTPSYLGNANYHFADVRLVIPGASWFYFDLPSPPPIAAAV